MFRDDKDFYYTGERRHSLFAYLMVALLGAMIGGLLVAFLAPQLAKGDYYQNNTKYEQTPPVVAGGDSPVIQIAEKVSPAVVGISNRVKVNSPFHPQPVEKGSGSGVIFDTRGYVVTNYHVIKDSDQIMVTLANGKVVPGKIVGGDQRTDLAVVKIEEKGLTAARFGDSDKLRVGELAVAIGNPLGEQLASTVTAGVISALNRTVDIEEKRLKLVQTDAAISPGNSGGALVNSRGEVIGINSVKIVDVEVEGLNFAIPINSVKPIVESIIKNGKVIRPWIGILGGDVDPVAVQQYKLAVNKGVFVSQLPAGSPSAKAGMQSGDVIIAFDGVEIKNFDDLRANVDKRKIGEKVDITIMRGKDKKVISVLLGQMP